MIGLGFAIFCLSVFFAFFHFQRGRSDAPADDVCENFYLLEISIDFEMMLRGVERVGFWGFLQRDLWGELRVSWAFLANEQPETLLRGANGM